MFLTGIVRQTPTSAVCILLFVSTAVAAQHDAAKRLEAISVPVLLRIYENVGHAFPPDRECELGRALEFVLKP